jgi:hypothetical protein
MPRDIDEDLIEATIRRVAESKAARSGGIEMPVDDAVAPVFGGKLEDSDHDEQAAPAAAVSAPDPDQDEPAPDEDGQPTAIAVMPRQHPRPVPMQAPVRPMPPPQLNGDVAAQLQAITQRLDAILPLLERVVGQSSVAAGGEWDRNPQQRAPMTIVPPAAREAVAVETDVIDTRPLPKPLPPLVEPKRGLDLLPRTYRITVEDKRRGVDLVPLHRAMIGIDGARDMSLLSYNNGVAIVALETVDALDPEHVRSAMARAMQREAKVEVHNENTLVVKLISED